jgi:hypothetical protein
MKDVIDLFYSTMGLLGRPQVYNNKDDANHTLLVFHFFEFNCYL